MDKLRVSQVREILWSMIPDSELREELSRKTDEELLDTDLLDEFGLDSLDFEEMLTEVYYQHDINVASTALCDSGFRDTPSVRNFIRMVNDYGE